MERRRKPLSEGTPISLPASEITMAEMLRDAGHATAMFGKLHLGAEPYSQPQNKGFDEFHGIPTASDEVSL